LDKFLGYNSDVTSFPGRLRAGHLVLVQGIGVQIPAREPFDKLMALRQNADMGWFVYILLCDQKTFYVGSTDDISRRLCQHQAKWSFYTKKFSDIRLAYQEELPNRAIAIARESQIKKWSIAKKRALIAGDISLLQQLSKAREVVE
jgi:putative endonuclease